MAVQCLIRIALSYPGRVFEHHLPLNLVVIFLAIS